MLTIALAAAIALSPHQGDMAQAPLTCAVLGTTAADGGPSVDYKGVKYALCCAMCQSAFQKDPDKAIHSDKAQGKTIGTFLFDPVTSGRITPTMAKASVDYKGVRYLFLSSDEKKTFSADPVKYTKMPEKEALFCPIEKQKLSGYMAAGSYRDYEGVRYYFCCDGCPTDFAKDPAKYAKVAAEYVAQPKAIIPAVEKKEEKDADTFTAVQFNCKHCGRPMAINSADDGKSTCSACNCGKTMNECKGN
jgi:YHS domain-containing protein